LAWRGSGVFGGGRGRGGRSTAASFFLSACRVRAAAASSHALPLPLPLNNTQNTVADAGLSTLWMSAGWNYYTRDAAGLASPTASAETAPRPKEREE